MAEINSSKLLQGGRQRRSSTFITLNYCFMPPGSFRRATGPVQFSGISLKKRFSPGGSIPVICMKNRYRGEPFQFCTQLFTVDLEMKTLKCDRQGHTEAKKQKAAVTSTGHQELQFRAYSKRFSFQIKSECGNPTKY